MTRIRFTFLAVLFLLLSLDSAGQTPPVELQKYRSSEKRCNDAINAANWVQAKSACGKALAESESLAQDFKREKMEALDNYAFALFRQSNFKEALAGHTKALEIGKTFLANDSLELGLAYFNLGRSNQGMASIDGSYIEAAVENYLIAEKIYREALRSNVDAEKRSELTKRLRNTLVLQEYIALLREQTKEAGEFRKKIEELDEEPIR